MSKEIRSFENPASTCNASLNLLPAQEPEAELKKRIRKRFRRHIQSKKVDFEKASQKLSARLFGLNIWKKGLIVAGYRALPDELCAGHFYQKYQKKCHFVFPKMKNGEMIFVSAKWNRAKDWEKGPFGCYQPAGKHSVSIHKIAVFLVPALAFDRKGRRLGRGYGFYDRALAQTRALKLGLAGSMQISELDLPEEDHDIKMSALLTESFCLVPALNQTGLKFKGFLENFFSSSADGKIGSIKL